MAQPQADQHYDGVARALHWLILALLAVQFALAWTMPDIPRGQLPETLTDLHLSVGVVILAAGSGSALASVWAALKWAIRSRSRRLMRAMLSRESAPSRWSWLYNSRASAGKPSTSSSCALSRSN